MTSNLKVTLSALGLTALVASPAMAKSHARLHVAPAAVPAYGQVYAPAYAGRVVTPYAPNLPVPAHKTPGQGPDFQTGGEK
jgi:hypothetical protein